MDSYRQSQPAVGLSVERLTSAVPGDGYYYVLLGGAVKGRFKTLKRALARYKELLAEVGWKPPSREPTLLDPGVEAVERYMDELTTYWDSSHQHRRPGVRRA